MRISVDTTRCVGSAQCSRTEPRVFDQDDEDGTVVLLLPEPPAELHAAVRTATDICPVRAIHATESGLCFEPFSNTPRQDGSSESRLPTVREGTVP